MLETSPRLEIDGDSDSNGGSDEQDPLIMLHHHDGEVYFQNCLIFWAVFSLTIAIPQMTMTVGPRILMSRIRIVISCIYMCAFIVIGFIMYIRLFGFLPDTHLSDNNLCRIHGFLFGAFFWIFIFLYLHKNTAL